MLLYQLMIKTSSTVASGKYQEAEPGPNLSLVELLLANRGIKEKEQIERFIDPSYDRHLNDPFLLKDITQAVERIARAVRDQERIMIYADYDADGIPGAVVLADFFRDIGFDNFEVYIPHRHDEGFGVHLEAVDKFVADGTKLLITIDCGVADETEVAKAMEQGLDVIITDHHEPNSSRPPAAAIIDPKQPDCSYPDKNLCGAGVIFKLIRALMTREETYLPPGREKWYLDMVGLATLSDMVPLVEENRVLAYYGLKVLRVSRRPGLVRMLRELRIRQSSLTEDDIGFMIAPRINAASRMGVATDAYTFLSLKSPEEAEPAVQHLNRINEERKGMVAAIVKEIRKKITKQGMEDKRVIVTGDPKWRPSLLGLAAGTLAREYERPVFLWGKDGSELLKGSARSEGVTDLQQLMTEAREVMKSYGGHSLAGGFAIDHEHIHQLPDGLEQAAAKLQQDNPEQHNSAFQVEVDAELRLADVNDDVCRQVEKLAPFGIGNPKPLFRFARVKIEKVRTFGKQNAHLELILNDNEGYQVKAIGFFQSPADFDADITPGAIIDLLAHLERSFFGGREEVRLRVADIKL